jgi:hypothetical protein
MTVHSVIPLHQDTMHRARKIALSAGLDWPRKLGAAQTLSQSADPTDTALARHVFTAYSLDLQDMLKPVDPSHRDRSDRVDQWKEAAIRCEEEETSARIVFRHKDRWPTILLGGGFWAAIMLVLSGWA